MEAGDFLYIPRGEIHGNKNLSDTEPVEEITCHAGVTSFEDEATVRVEHLWENKR
jgi:mannose-6-phosphate isomerase-like protein (cupin superfamily)